MTTLLDRSTVKARVNHICFWCGSEIEVGEQYIKSTQVDSGIFDTIKSHKKCDHLLNNLIDKYGDTDGMSPDDFSCMLSDFIEDKKCFNQVHKIICRGNINDMVNEAYNILKGSEASNE